MKRLTFLLLFSSCSVSAAPLLQSSDAVTTTGTFRLFWSSQHVSPDYLLEECTNDPCRSLYRGHDEATVISGRHNGVYRFRISEASSPDDYSVISVTVQHHPLSRALMVLSGGFLLFVLCAAALVAGEIRVKRNRRTMNDAS